MKIFLVVLNLFMLHQPVWPHLKCYEVKDGAAFGHRISHSGNEHSSEGLLLQY